jgi:hypothetical protein
VRAVSDEPFDPGEAEVAALVEAALGQAQRESARDKVIEAALDAGIRLWRDELGEAFASLPRPEGGIERFRVRSRPFGQRLRLLYGRAYPVTGRGGRRRPGSVPIQAMQDALGALEAMAMALEGEIRAPRPKVCPGADGEIWIDLGDESWRCLKVTSQGWEIVADADVPLIRPPGMLALPGPVRAPGALDRLCALLNLPTEAGFQLVVMWMLAALRPAGPYPLLALDGEQGSGKSTASKMVRRLVDPNAADVRAAPGNERDLLVAARGSQGLALDNLSFVLEDMADGLCRLARRGVRRADALHKRRGVPDLRL